MPTRPTPVPPKVGTELTLELGSHFVRVSNFGPRVRPALFEMCDRLAQFGFTRSPNGRFVRTMLRVFVGVTRDRTVFNFHRNLLSELFVVLERHGYGKGKINVVELPKNYGDDIELELIDLREPRDYQVELVDYITDEGVTKVATIDPGRGKTFTALLAISKIKKRTFVCIKAMYVEKWISDIEKAFKIKKGDIIVIKGSASLKAVTQMAVDGTLDAKFVICSNMTFYNYLKEYEIHKEGILEMGYACLPHEFYDVCGFGIRLIDEVHQDFHLNYRQDLYTNVEKTISLSGTLEGDDPFVNSRVADMFPPHWRIKPKGRVVYAEAVGLEYRLRVGHRLRWLNHSRKSYSHVLFEQSIMKQKDILKAYMDMVGMVITETYLQEFKRGQKCLVYAATVEMCTKLHRHFEQMFPEHKVVLHVQGTSIEDTYKGEIIVSTLKSLGTAQDIPDLLTVIMTDALGSSTANLQAFGRLRELLQWEGSVPKFYYLVCADIDKHIEYHHRKKEAFTGRVLSHKYVPTGVTIADRGDYLEWELSIPSIEMGEPCSEELHDFELWKHNQSLNGSCNTSFPINKDKPYVFEWPVSLTSQNCYSSTPSPSTMPECCIR